MKPLPQLFLLLILPALLFSQAGTIDLAFGQAGELRYALPGGYFTRLVGLPDGRLVAAGASTAGIHLVRFEEDGQLDAAFGHQGRATLRLERSSINLVQHFIRQTDGSLLAAGTFYPERKASGFLMRFTPSGQPDIAFGTDGLLAPDLEGATTAVEALAVQPDGKIILSGELTGEAALRVGRLHADGRPDVSFGRNGVVTVEVPGMLFGQVQHLAVLPDGRILGAGYAVHTTEGEALNDQIFFRLLTDGSADLTFGNGGVVVLDAAEQELVYSLLVQPDGRVLAMGWGTDDLRESRLNIVRLQPDGSLDGSFQLPSNFGKVAGDPSTTGAGAALQADGKVIVCGQTFHSEFQGDLLTIRLQDNGRIDSLFGSRGYSQVLEGLPNDRATSLLVRPAGKIVVLGTQFSDSGAAEGLVLVRYKNDLVSEAGEPTDVVAALEVMPNPTRHDPLLALTLAQPARLTLQLYDLNGRLVHTYHRGQPYPAGRHQERLPRAAAIGAGAYLLVLDTGTERVTRRVVFFD